MTSTPAARAAVISGRVGTPGDITTRSAVVNARTSWPPSCHVTGTPASCAIGPTSLSAVLPSSSGVRRAVIASPQLQRAEREQREQQRHQPEPDDDLRLVPALLLVVM